MSIISNDELRRRVSVNIPNQAPYNLTKEQKLENIASFNALSRDGLESGSLERRVLLYETLAGEKVYMQYPGSESVRVGERQFALDARPILQKTDGTFLDDMDFKKIWDIIDRLGHGHMDDIDVLATVFLRIAYMLEYQHYEQEYLCETINTRTNTVVETQQIMFTWNALALDADVIETLNDRFRIAEGISLEGFLYYNDLLSQNEDCKYHFLKGNCWDIKTGRINNCLSHLTVISHLRGRIGISKLIDSFQRTGVAPLPQYRLDEACGDLIRRGR